MFWHIDMYAQMHIFLYMYINMYVYMHKYMYVYVYMLVFAHVCVHINIFTYEGNGVSMHKKTCTCTQIHEYKCHDMCIIN